MCLRENQQKSCRFRGSRGDQPQQQERIKRAMMMIQMQLLLSKRLQKQLFINISSE
jgi:hypothetical protein